MIVFLIILTGKALFSIITRKSRETIRETKERFSENSEIYKSFKEEEFEREERNRMLYVNLNGESNVVEKPKPAKEKSGLVDRWLHNGEKKEFPKDVTSKKKDTNDEQDISDIFGADNMFRPAKPITVTPASAVSDPFPYTITGAVDDTPEGPVPTDMKEITPKRRGTVRLSNEEATIPGYADKNASSGLPAGEGEYVENNLDTPETSVKDASKEPVRRKAQEGEKVKADPKLNEETAAQIDANMAGAELPKKYVFPPVTLLNESKAKNGAVSKKEVERNADALIGTLESFGVRVKLLNVSCGPTVTRYELAPEHGVKVSSITKLESDIKLNLAAADIRIEAPIPGKAAIGIEVPNKENSTVSIRELIESNEFKKQEKGITFAVGKDISGECIVTDISKMPHLLIAGATGSGKSVCINTLIMSILYKFKPEDIRLIMIDPKMVELGVYNGIPHLLIPVVTDPKKAAASLNWAVLEMTNRYEKFAEAHVRDLKGYNAYIEAEKKKPENKADVAENPEKYAKMPQIVIIVDELADLMMVAPGEVENAIIRLSQLARAAGMHLVIATQRPSVNVITGLIKANMPSRIALAVTSNVDSRTILDQGGAEKLLGKGDMLFAPMNLPKPIRVQGAFVSDGEVEKVVTFIKEENTIAEYNEEVTSKINSMNISGGKTSAPIDTSEASGGSDEDEYLVEAARLIIEKQKASIGMLQRVYRIGFNRAARIVDTLTDMGVLGPENGTKSREILMTKEQFDEFIQNKGE
ncbi:MAG: DNA translocase FtsK [Lachnospiraceae bacterium]|nr:DNA translocase FtsK [Lachnospiraceae bacterium]